MSDKFNVLDMVDQYAEENDIDTSDVFKKKEEPKQEEEAVLSGEETKEEPKEEEKEEKAVVKPNPKKLGEWKPDVSDMPELQGSGAVYNKEDVKLEEDHTLRNLSDDAALEDSKGTMADLERKEANIEEIKKKFGITKLQIPEGFEQVEILMAASNPNHKEAQEQLEVLFNNLVNTHPEFILEWEPGREPENWNSPVEQSVEQQAEAPVNSEQTEGKEPEKIVPIHKMSAEELGIDPTDTKIIIDKRGLTDISWTKEEVEKIRKSRTVELNIVEKNDIEFGSIKNVTGNAVDAVLAQYQRKTNDVVAALPASHYRASFTGLTYPEVIDLSTSNEMNNIDGEYKKWSICFAHIRNQSIGPWEEYTEYVDPKTEKIIRVDVGTDIPEGVDQDTVHTVTKFEDFLRKTSFMDLEFMLWKILCATTMDKEVVSIDCKSTYNGKPCGKSYEWIYSPNELLVTDQINPAVLEEIKKTGEVSTQEDIIANYNDSPLNSKDYVKLHTSGFAVVYGHVSAYVYLTELYSRIQDLSQEENDPTVISRSMTYSALTTIKEIIIPDENGKYTSRITGTANLVKVLDILDEIDWQTISEITRMMVDPYQFKFSMRDIVCPKCKNKSAIAIDSMSRLLFIVARSLSSVQVTLRKA